MVRLVEVLVACALTGLLSLANSCSPQDGGYTSLTLAEKMKNSRSVAHGVVQSHQPDRTYPGSNVYSVAFEVRCIYKGGALDPMIMIDKVGTVPGLCESTDMPVGRKFLVYIEEHDGRYTQTYTPDPAEDEYLEEIYALCETKITYPEGYNKTYNRGKCHEQPPMKDCLLPPDVTTPAPHPLNDLSPSPEGITGDQHPGSPQEPDTSVPYQPVLDPQQPGDGNNGSPTWNIHFSTLSYLLLFVVLL